MTRILFLDFDGPIVTFEETKKKRRPACSSATCIAALNSAVAQTGALVVVTSAWRITNSVDALATCLLDWGFRGVVLDATPYLDGKRCVEICSWLLKYVAFNHERPEFVIVDDESTDLWMLRDRLVKVDPLVGLTERDVDEIVSKFAESAL